jgi:chromosome segregation ATPase
MLQLNGGSSTAAIATPGELRRQLTAAQAALNESRQHAQQLEQQLSELRANTERLQRDKASLKTELATLRRDLGGVSTDILAELTSGAAGGSNQVRLLGGTITAAEVLQRWERLSEVERARDEALQSLDRAQRAAQRKERQWELEKQQLQVRAGLYRCGWGGTGRVAVAQTTGAVWRGAITLICPACCGWYTHVASHHC